jgi:hypothetical protein
MKMVSGLNFLGRTIKIRNMENLLAGEPEYE